MLSNICRWVKVNYSRLIDLANLHSTSRLARWLPEVAWLLPVLDRPQHLGSIERLNVDAMEPGLGIQGGLVWFRSPTLPWLPTHPIA
jgi:hypothetical protein